LSKEIKPLIKVKIRHDHQKKFRNRNSCTVNFNECGHNVSAKANLCALDKLHEISRED